VIELRTEKYCARFFDRFDDDARRFEDRLRGDAPLAASAPWPRISFWQGYRHLQSLSRRYFVLQLARADSRRAYQVAVVEHASRIVLFRSGVASHWIPSLEPGAHREQVELMTLLRALCRERTALMSLRVHCYVPGEAALDGAESVLRESGFEACDRQFPARTRIVDLRPPIEEILARFPTKTRTKLKLKKPEEVRIRELALREHIPALRSALDDSFRRSAAGRHAYDFESLFGVLERFPEAAAAFGLFLSDDWSAPKAFISGVGSAPLFEYSAAGSLSHDRLRRLPFNYILLWRLVEAAKARGASTFDMGGITDGSPDDPLAGISDFKRRFPGFEVDVGRERLAVLRPLRHRASSLLRALKSRVRPSA
jgi:hypothetical protein